MQIAPETLGQLAAALGAVSLSVLFALSEAGVELPEGPRGLFRLPPGKARPDPPSLAGLLAVLLAGAVSIALNVSTNLCLPSPRESASRGVSGGVLFAVAVLLLPLSAVSHELGSRSRNSLLRLLFRRRERGQPWLVGGIALVLGLMVTGSAHALFDLRRFGGAPPPAVASMPAEQAPLALHRPVALSAERLEGTYVGTVDEETLVLFVARRADPDRVECTLNARTRESITFEARVDERRGLVGTLPELDASFGHAYQDGDGRLFLPLVSEQGKVLGELSEIESGRGAEAGKARRRLPEGSAGERETSRERPSR